MKKKTEFNMYDFLKSGTTKYGSMYEIIGSYIPELKEDYSTANLINKSMEIAEAYNAKNFITNKYSLSFKDLTDILLLAANGTESSDVRMQLTPKQVEVVLGKLKEASSGIYECQNFETIDEFVRYGKDNLENEQSKPLRDELVKVSVALASKKMVQDIKFSLVGFYVGLAGTKVREKYDQFQRANETIPEWEIMQYVQWTLDSRHSFEKYDNMYVSYMNEIEKFQRETAMKRSLQAKREDRFLADISSTLTVEEKNKVDKEGWESVLTYRRSGNTVPKKGTVDWHYQAFEKPELICDTVVKYSDDGDEYQRVVMISYGKFHYNDGLFDSSIVQSELVGISRIGKDGIYSYSKIIPLDTISFRDTDKAKKGEGRVKFSTKGKEINVKDDKTKNVLFGFHSRKVPEDYRYSFVADFTADKRLQLFDEHGIEFLGMQQRCSSGIKIENEDLAGAEANAVAYACKYPEYKQQDGRTLLDIKEAPSFRARHNALVGAVMKGEFDKEIARQKASVSYVERDADMSVYQQKPILNEGEDAR